MPIVETTHRRVAGAGAGAGFLGAGLPAAAATAGAGAAFDLTFLEELDPEVWEIADGRLKRLGYGCTALTKYINAALKDPEPKAKPAQEAERDPTKYVEMKDLTPEQRRARQAAIKSFFDKGMRAKRERYISQGIIVEKQTTS
jgi:hypothetical protein